MTKNKYFIIEVICVGLLIAFIIFLFVSRSGGTQKPIKEISAPVLKVADISEMQKKSEKDAAKVFGFDLEKSEGLIYYCNDNIMDCSELLIIKLKSEQDASTFKELIKQRVDNQMSLFKNYAPDQYALLKNSVIETDGNTIFYCTAKNADAVYTAFKKAL